MRPELEKLVREGMSRYHVPGIAIGILHDGDEDIATYGVTNLEHPLPVDADTLFQIASITKTITATVVMRLVERGALDLDAPPGIAARDRVRAAADRHLVDDLVERRMAAVGLHSPFVREHRQPAEPEHLVAGLVLQIEADRALVDDDGALDAGVVGRIAGRDVLAGERVVAELHVLIGGGVGGPLAEPHTVVFDEVAEHDAITFGAIREQVAHGGALPSPYILASCSRKSKRLSAASQSSSRPLCWDY